MLNPSTADERFDDQTRRRCITRAKSLGCADLMVTNLFAKTATYPRELLMCSDPVGPLNDPYIREAALHARYVICAWGTMGTLLRRDELVLRFLRVLSLYCLGTTKEGHPRHPCRLAHSVELVPFYPEVGQ
jgi:hypothetical protein